MSDVADFISEIETMYRREYKDEENSFIRDRLFTRNYNRKILIAALADIEKIDSDYLPAPKKVVAVVEKVSYDMGPKENFKPEEVTTNPGSLQFKMAKKLRELIFSGKVSRQDILDSIRKADGVMKHSGWDTCGMTLEKHYRDGNYDLSEPPMNFIMADDSSST